MIRGGFSYSTTLMETPDYEPQHTDASRPSIGFPLGTALLLIVLFSLSGVISCCYHWDKFKSLRGSQDPEAQNEQSTSKPIHAFTKPKQYEEECVTVLMPGDMVPKFIALPCPCEPPRPPKNIAYTDKPAKPPPIIIPIYI